MPSSRDPYADDDPIVRQCTSCERRSPPARSDYTLFSVQHGWRLDRCVFPDGRAALAWYCPFCWKAKKGS